MFDYDYLVHDIVPDVLDLRPHSSDLGLINQRTIALQYQLMPNIAIGAISSFECIGDSLRYKTVCL
jgi:hypothetical protein